MQHGDPGDCLREMLAEWLRGVGEPPRTWSTIVAALKKVGGLEAIAEEIESKFNLVDKAITRDISPQGNINPVVFFKFINHPCSNYLCRIIIIIFFIISSTEDQ